MAEISDGPLEDRDATSHLASKSSRSSPINANATPTNPPDVLMTEDSTTILDDSTFPPTEKTQPDESTPPKMGDSQPMTASSSSSSHPSLRESGTSGTAAPAPYGTRSRNRTAGSRPNYAEDKEMEMEYECTGATGNPNVASKPALQVEEPQSENTQPQKISGVSTRRAAASTTNSQGSSNGVLNQASANPKEPIPGLSSFPVISTTGTTTGSKKRKAGASNGTTGTSASSGPGQVTTRRTSMAVGNSSHGRLTNMLSFEMSQGYLKHGKLKADDGTTLAVNDHVYLICEPPGEPYYLARIMEFLHAKNEPTAPIDAIRVNWYYRPRDIQRKVTDTRVVFASMHSDACPLTSLRGKCTILHRTEVEDIDEYRKTKDCFWYEKMFDRYIHRYYEVIATSQVINVPAKVKKVLDERWRFVIVEMGRGKELTSAVKSCKRCSQYSASNDSVECAVCHSTYHMNCVRPPLLKKPSRGFAWACGPCSRAQEKRLEARNIPIVNKKVIEGEEEEIFDEEEEHPAGTNESLEDGSAAGSDDQDTAIRPATAEQLAHSRLWPYRYLGIHCRVEDALDYDDRIYPRASSRLGPRHQANVNVWHGRPVELVKPAEIKRKYVKGGAHKKDTKLSKETLAALEADKQSKEWRPKWVLDEPYGYVRRGEDNPNNAPENTSKTVFRLPEVGEYSSRGEDDIPALASKSQEEREELVDDYMRRAKSMAKSVGVDEYTTNFLDKALEVFYAAHFDAEVALKKVKSFNRKKDLKEPELNKEELKRFEEGITKYGSELQTVGRHVRTQPQGDIVRFYYVWKKTDRGKQVWGNYEGRKGKKEAKKYDAGQSKLVDDVADDFDDSAFDNEKALDRKRGFECKFCTTHKSRQWQRAPGVSPGTTVPVEAPSKPSGKDKGRYYVLALCRRCGELWRRYGIQWEDIEEVAKKVAQGGGRAWKRRIDEELLKELMAANEAALTGAKIEGEIEPAATGKEAVTLSQSILTGQEPVKKKQKMTTEKDRIDPAPTPAAAAPAPMKVKKVPEKPERSPTPEMPKPKVLPCSVCSMMEPLGDQHLSCKECRMTVHRQCYGVTEVRHPSKWVCDTCSNDKNPQVSTCYECVLCPVKQTEHDFVESPKITYRKKQDRDREKEKVEKERAVAAAKFYAQRQEEMNRPLNPREPLKRTAGNNWVHVTCAVWTSEMKFGNAKALEPLEGIGTILPSHFERVCKVCKTNDGACITCHQCHAPVHVACAQQNGYTLGFDVTPVKSSRRDVVSTVTVGEESGQMAAAVWCKEHASSIKTIVHYMDEVVDDTGLNTLQLFVRNFKQADLTLTGTIRKANLVNQSTRAISQLVNLTTSTRRISNTANGLPYTPSSATRSTFKNEDTDSWPVSSNQQDDVGSIKKTCHTCEIDVSPKWWPFIPTVSQVSAPINSSTPYSTHLSMTNGDGPNGHFHGPSDALYSSSSSSSRPEQTSLSNDYAVQQDDSLTFDHLIGNLPGTARTADVLQCHKCHWRKIQEPSPPPVAQPVVQPARPVQVPAAPALASPQLPWIAHQLPSVQPQRYMDGPPDAVMADSVDRNGYVSPQIRVAPQIHHHSYNGHVTGTGHAHPAPPHTSPQQLPSAAHGPPHMMAPANKPIPPTNGSISAHGGNGAYGPSRPGPELHYHPPASMTNQQMGQLPPMGFGAPHRSPPLSHNRPSTPRDQVQGSSMNGARAPSEGRTPGGASASPSLRNLLH